MNGVNIMEKLILDNELSKVIHDLMHESNKEYNEGKYDKVIEILKKAWLKLPNPKENYSESYHLAQSICEAYILINNFEEAKKWSNEFSRCATFRIDSGERYFLAAKVLFGLERFDMAQKYFAVANKMSDGRCFEDEDDKYINFFKKSIIKD